MIEHCLCILMLVAAAAIVKLVFFRKAEKADKKESDKDGKVPRVIYILRSRPCFHLSGCKHLDHKHPDIYKLCDDCDTKLMKE